MSTTQITAPRNALAKRIAFILPAVLNELEARMPTSEFVTFCNSI